MIDSAIIFCSVSKKKKEKNIYAARHGLIGWADKWMNDLLRKKIYLGFNEYICKETLSTYETQSKVAYRRVNKSDKASMTKYEAKHLWNYRF